MRPSTHDWHTKTEFKKGHKTIMTPEIKQKIRLAKLGSLNPAWKGGISKDSKRYRTLRRSGKLLIKIVQMVYEDNIKQYGTLTCYLCLKPIAFKEDSLDHKLPLSRGGTNEYSNLAIAHLSCNHKKNAKTVEEYRKYANLAD